MVSFFLCILSFFFGAKNLPLIHEGADIFFLRKPAQPTPTSNSTGPNSEKENNNINVKVGAYDFVSEIQHVHDHQEFYVRIKNC